GRARAQGMEAAHRGRGAKRPVGISLPAAITPRFRRPSLELHDELVRALAQMLAQDVDRHTDTPGPVRVRRAARRQQLPVQTDRPWPASESSDRVPYANRPSVELYVGTEPVERLRDHGIDA